MPHFSRTVKLALFIAAAAFAVGGFLFMEFNMRTFALPLFLLALMALVLGGCNTTPYGAVKQSIDATDVAMKTGNALLNTGTIDVGDATTLYLAGTTAAAGETTWLSDLESNQPVASTVADSVTAALGQISQILARPKAPASISGKLALRLAIAQTSSSSTPVAKRVVDPATVIAIIQLAAQLTPQIEAWISSALSNTAPTAADANNSLALLQTDLGLFKSSINAHGGSLP